MLLKIIARKSYSLMKRFGWVEDARHSFSDVFLLFFGGLISSWIFSAFFFIGRGSWAVHWFFLTYSSLLEWSGFFLWCSRFLASFIGSYWVLLGFIGIYRVLLGFSGFEWLKMSFYRVLLGFFWVWVALNGFSRVLLGFIGIYRFLLGFSGFEWL